MLEGIEAIVFRTVGDQCSLWESVLPPELLRLPEELARVDAMLDDPAFYVPFVPFFDPRMCRQSTPMETYLRLMFLKFRYRLGWKPPGRSVEFHYRNPCVHIDQRIWCQYGVAILRAGRQAAVYSVRRVRLRSCAPT